MTTDVRRRSLTRRHVLLGATAIAVNALAAACGQEPTAPIGAAPTPAPSRVVIVSTPLPSPTSPPPPGPTATPSRFISVPTVTERFATPTGTPTIPLIVFVGAGLTYGVGLARDESYPAQTIALLAPAKYDAVNLGGTGLGWTVERMNDMAPQTIDPLYAASRRKNIVVLFDVHNDLYTNVSVQDTFTRLVTFCQARQGVGFKVVIGTLVPSSFPVPGVQGGPGQDYEPLREAVNALIRKNRASFADALADVGADPTIGVVAATDNREYFQTGGLQLTPKGDTIVAGIVKAAILTL